MLFGISGEHLLLEETDGSVRGIAEMSDSKKRGSVDTFAAP